MQAIVSTVASWIGAVISWLGCFFTDFFFCKFFNLFFDVMAGGVAVLVSALAWVPVPSALANFQWPDPGPLGGLLLATGVGQAMGILAAAMTTKFLLRLIPFVRL